MKEISQCTPAPRLLGSTPDASSQIFLEPVGLLQAAALKAAKQHARTIFGWDRLRLFQHKAIEAWAAGRNCFLISGTGSGKTGGFVLPAIVARAWHEQQGGNRHGPPPVALVVSPLVALMRDQVNRLTECGVPAAVCSPQCGDPMQAWRRAQNGELAICYMSPELLIKYTIQGQIERLPHVSLFAVDEAHCISEWGYNFRPEYSDLNRVIAAVRNAGYGGRPPPVLCVTATCTMEVRADIMRSMQMVPGMTDFVTGTMNRPNIFYSAEELPDAQRMQRRILELFGVSGLDRATAQARGALAFDRTAPGACAPTVVYAWRKKDCDELAWLLGSGGVKVQAFHSSLTNERKENVQAAFHRGELQAVVATVAFGMGIDKPDVRRVIHYGLPRSLEAYAQESGRGGRDGGPTQCIVLFTPRDRDNCEMAILNPDKTKASEGGPILNRSLQRLQKALGYSRCRTVCRRFRLLQSLGEDALDSNSCLSSQSPPKAGTPGYCAKDEESGHVKCWHCDVCCAADRPSTKDMGAELHVLLRHVATQEASPMGRPMLISMLQKSNRTCGLPRDGCLRLIDEAVVKGFLEIRASRNGSSVYVLTRCGKTIEKSDEVNAFPVEIQSALRLPRGTVQLPAWVPARPPSVDEGQHLLGADHQALAPQHQQGHAHSDVHEKLPGDIRKSDGPAAARDAEQRFAPHGHASKRLDSDSVGNGSAPSSSAADRALFACSSAADQQFLEAKPTDLMGRMSADCHEVINGFSNVFNSQPPALGGPSDARGQSDGGLSGTPADGPAACGEGVGADISASCAVPMSWVAPESWALGVQEASHAAGSSDRASDDRAWFANATKRPLLQAKYSLMDEGLLSIMSPEKTSKTPEHESAPLPATLLSCDKSSVEDVLMSTALPDPAAGPPAPGAEMLQVEAWLGTDSGSCMLLEEDSLCGPPEGLFEDVSEEIISLNEAPKRRRCEEGQGLRGARRMVHEGLIDIASPVRVPGFPLAIVDLEAPEAEAVQSRRPQAASSSSSSSRMPVAVGQPAAPHTMRHPVVAFFEQFPNMGTGQDRCIDVGAGQDRCIDVDAGSVPSPKLRTGPAAASSSTPAQLAVVTPGRSDLIAAAAARAMQQVVAAAPRRSGGAPRAAARRAFLQLAEPAGAVAERTLTGKIKRRMRSYTEAQRAAATPFLRKLMEAADFRSNFDGGATAFKHLMREVVALAPPKYVDKLNEVFMVFRANSKGRHGNFLDRLIDDWSSHR